MSSPPSPQVVIVDYRMGNLFSVKQACEQVGLRVAITSSRAEILAADGVILPGVGAFAVAMETLNQLDLVSVLRDYAGSGRPLFGICLGMQLLMSESHEFGAHRGLDIIEGEVVRLEEAEEGALKLKIPQVGWNRIHVACHSGMGSNYDGVPPPWQETLLEGLSDGEYMYFVHSFYPKPVDQAGVLSVTRYGPVEFCSSFSYGNVAACQFHPERSGPQGLRVYLRLAQWLVASGKGEIDA